MINKLRTIDKTGVNLSELRQQVRAEIDRVYCQKEALVRYKRLTRQKNTELSLDDKLFLENYKAALYLWGLNK